MTDLSQNCGKDIQGDSGGKVNILECDSVGHCKKMCSCEHLCNSEWLPSRPVCIYKCKIIVKGNKER